MGTVQQIIRLGLEGLLLNPTAYRDQRDSPEGLRRGFMLILVIGLLVGVSSLIGDLGEAITRPSAATISQTVYDGLRDMPWYQDRREADPNFPDQFDQIFNQVNQSIQMFSGGIGRSMSGVITTPLMMLLGWLIFSLISHPMARALGGQASFSQTMACTALAAGANLLAIVQVVPFAQVAGTALLGLIASYVAIREAHQLQPWRAFWATMIGPIMLGVLVIITACIGTFLVIGALSAALQGVN
ncbi:Yip1 family protein [Candidatus Oscillochloris fontis]|uniref:Yip1 family protein n=1 Tax=Candidatus Oscillochloris fontis TaxID=2496868 RepID=UPI00101C8D87|nr:Yip1 family protein [Candidatus Oscillochloris fontis]